MSTALVVDIGNTSTAIALYQRGTLSRIRRIATGRATRKSIAAALRGLRFDFIVIASVVPSANAAWTSALRKPIHWVTHKSKLGIRMNYPKPATIGADRLADACAAFHKYGAPLIVVDFGTATTFGVVVQDAFAGGVIAPGFAMMLDYLGEKTAKLPRLEPRAVRGNPGKSTEDAMRLGAQWGYKGLIHEILKQLTRNPELARAKLIATGGHVRHLARDLPRRMIVDQNLTLYGLGKISELNS